MESGALHFFKNLEITALSGPPPVGSRFLLYFAGGLKAQVRFLFHFAKGFPFRVPLSGSLSGLLPDL